jgi:hypothetical protein
MMVHVFSPSNWKLRQQDCEFKASLGLQPCLKNEQAEINKYIQDRGGYSLFICKYFAIYIMDSSIHGFCYPGMGAEANALLIPRGSYVYITKLPSNFARHAPLGAPVVFPIPL